MLWTIVLAGGSGTRLSAEARRRYGYARPKQYCDFDGTGTLLEKTIDRARRLEPDGGVLVVTSREHRAEADEVLGRQAGVVEIEQPCGRDTIPGIVLPLLHVLWADPGATVVLMPSDHHVDDEDVLEGSVNEAIERTKLSPRPIALLGADPPDHDSGYGWVVPDAEDGVREFREKPPAAELASLRARGALVNTFLLVGPAVAMAAAVAAHAPGWWRALSGAGADLARVEAAYDVLPRSNFSSEVLERIPSRLSVVRMPREVGWSDVGTPERLAAACRPLSRPELASAFC